MFSDRVDLREIAQQMIATFDLMIARQNAFRDRHGKNAIHDIQYIEQMRDPMGQIRKLYAHFGEPLSAAANSAMTRLLKQNPQGKHGKHEYSLEEFGLDAAGVRHHFRDYCERFGIPLKGAA
jgi:hypothetical protein